LSLFALEPPRINHIAGKAVTPGEKTFIKGTRKLFISGKAPVGTAISIIDNKKIKKTITIEIIDSSGKINIAKKVITRKGKVLGFGTTDGSGKFTIPLTISKECNYLLSASADDGVMKSAVGPRIPVKVIPEDKLFTPEEQQLSERYQQKIYTGWTDFPGSVRRVFSLTFNDLNEGCKYSKRNENREGYHSQAASNEKPVALTRFKSENDDNYLELVNILGRSAEKRLIIYYYAHAPPGGSNKHNLNRGESHAGS
ncbi:hypothetical protein ACFL35_21880, partial [Candidatus Riflebacteria bacterium]